MAEEGAYGSTNMDEKNLLDYCRVVWKRRGLITTLCVVSILISAVYTFWVPKLYRATATILPPKEIGTGIGNQMSMSLGSLFSMGRGNQGGNSGENSLGSLFSGSGPIFAPSTPERDTYIALLKSRTMLQEVVEHLKKEWGPSVGSLIGERRVSLSDDGVISVTVEAQDTALSAEAANYYFENLSSSLARRSKATATVQKEYFDRQLDRTRQGLKKAQEALIKFQEKNRYIALDPATKGAIEMGAMFAGSVMTLEMERNLKRNYLTESHPEMIALNRRIFEAKKLLSHRIFETSDDFDSATKTPARNAPIATDNPTMFASKE